MAATGLWQAVFPSQVLITQQCRTQWMEVTLCLLEICIVIKSAFYILFHCEIDKQPDINVLILYKRNLRFKMSLKNDLLKVTVNGIAGTRSQVWVLTQCSFTQCYLKVIGNYLIHPKQPECSLIFLTVPAFSPAHGQILFSERALGSSSIQCQTWWQVSWWYLRRCISCVFSGSCTIYKPYGLHLCIMEIIPSNHIFLRNINKLRKITSFAYSETSVYRVGTVGSKGVITLSLFGPVVEISAQTISTWLRNIMVLYKQLYEDFVRKVWLCIGNCPIDVTYPSNHLARKVLPWLWSMMLPSVLSQLFWLGRKSLGFLMYHTGAYNKMH